MRKILFLVLLLNCNKLNFNGLESNYKHPIDNRLINAIKKADDKEINNLLENVEKFENIRRTELRHENKNFLMVLLQYYGTNYELKNNEAPKNISKSKLEIFKKYLPDFKNIINDTDSNSKTIIFYAIDTGIGEIVTTLIDTDGIELEHLNKDRISPINYCILNDTSIFNYLNNKKLNANSSLNYLSKFKMSKRKKVKGVPPLLAACMANKPDIVKKLLEHGVEVDIENEHDTKAIWLAAINGYEEVVEELLLKGAKHLSRKGIALDKVQTVMGVAVKAFLQKSLDVGIAGASAIAKAHGVDPGIPFGIDLKAFDSSYSDIDKREAYKEVRRIYKRGNWITKIKKEDININLLLGYIELLSDTIYKINKKYLEVKDIYKINRNNPLIVKKIYAIDKLSQEELNKDLAGVQDYIKKLHGLIVEIKGINIRDDEEIEISLTNFQKLLSDFLESYNRDKELPEQPYLYHNLSKDKEFAAYLKSKQILSFHQLERLVNKAIGSLMKYIGLINYEKALKYLHDDFQRRTQINEDREKRNQKTKENLKKASKSIKNFFGNIKHTKKVSKINALMIENEKKQRVPNDSIVIEGNINYENIDLNKMIENIQFPEIDINSFSDVHYDAFIKDYKKLLIEKEALFNFIDSELK